MKSEYFCESSFIKLLGNTHMFNMTNVKIAEAITHAFYHVDDEYSLDYNPTLLSKIVKKEKSRHLPVHFFDSPDFRTELASELSDQLVNKMTMAKQKSILTYLNNFGLGHLADGNKMLTTKDGLFAFFQEIISHTNRNITEVADVTSTPQSFKDNKKTLPMPQQSHII